MKIYFTRHGESQANLLQVFSNRGDQHPLTEQGIQQAQGLAEKLSTLRISCIYSSPLQRAHQTAAILASRLRIAFEINDGLREFDCGILENTPINERASRIYKDTVNQWISGNSFAIIEGGESLNNIQVRFFKLISLIEKRHALTEKIVLVGHGGLYKAVLPILFTNISYDIIQQNPLGYTDIVLGEYSDHQWQCLSWCGQPIGV